MTRNQRILSLRGQLSYDEIADAVGCSRGTVAGVVWRAANPVTTRMPTANSRGSRNICGRGRRQAVEART